MYAQTYAAESYRKSGGEIENIYELTPYDDQPDSTTKTTPGTDASDTCRVCSQKAHGMHFGVLACRACAAFYRRSVVKNAKYTCRAGGNTCDLTPETKIECKLCRFNRCKAVGMTDHNIQLNRDSNQVIDSKALSSKKKMKEVNPTYEVPLMQLPPKDFVLPKKDHFIYIRDRVDKIFNSVQLEESSASTWLEKMEHALMKRRTVVSRNPPIVESMKITDVKPLQNDQKLFLAEWMMECPPFVKLENEDKWQLYANKWEQIYVMERIQMSIEVLGERAITEKLILFSDGFCGNRETFRMDCSAISDHDSEYVNRILNPFRTCGEVAENMYRMKPSTQEFTYMMLQCMWNVEDTNCKCSPETIDLSDRVRERFSDELHAYYAKTMDMKNYADRLHRLMNIVHAVREIIQNHEQMIELALLFNVFKIKDDLVQDCLNCV